MGSPARIAPPDGYELDEQPNAMRVPDSPRARYAAGGVGAAAEREGLRAVGNAMMAPPNAAFRLMDSYRPGSGEFSDQNVHDAIVAGPGALLPGFGRAASGVVDGLGAAGGRVRAAWTPEMVRRLRALAEEFPAGSPQRNTKIAENFREHFPDYPGSNSTIQTMTSRSKTWGGANQDTGAIGSGESSVKGAGDFELGAMGGRPQWANPGKATPTSRLLTQPEVTDTIMSLKTSGKTDKEIAEHLNDHFRLDEGTITPRSVTGTRQRAERAATTEDTGSTPSGTADDVAKAMRGLDYRNVKVSPAKTGDSLYVTGDPPGNPPRSVSDIPMVRVPADGHVGRPPSGREIGNRIDMGTPDSTTRTVNLPEPGVYQNAGGQRFAEPEAVEGFLRWRRGDLVSPDAAPGLTRETDRSLRGNVNVPHLKSTREGAAYPDAAPIQPDGPINDPRQLKLLSGGLPPGFVLDEPNDNAMRAK